MRKNRTSSFILDLFNDFEKPDGITPRYMEKQHYWEIGMKGFRRKDMKERMSRFFEVLHAYRNRDWFLSQNYVLKSRSAGILPGAEREDRLRSQKGMKPRNGSRQSKVLPMVEYAYSSLLQLRSVS